MTSLDLREPSVRARAMPPAKHVRPEVILAMACAAQAVVALDIAIVNVALPSIQRDLGVGSGAGQWVVVAYGLLLGGFLLFGGRMTDLLGRRRVFLTGLGVFTASSLTAGVAHGIGLLVAARGLQGFGAALAAPAALSLLAVTFPEGPERNRALGIFGAVGAASGSVGVVASGLLTDGPGWRWVFFINVPVGLVLIALATLVLGADPPRARSGRLDVAGATTVTGGLGLLVYALSRGAEHGWTSGSTLVLLGTATALLGGFARIEASAAAPLVPASALRNRTLVAANLSGFFTFSSFFSFIFVGSLLMQQALGYSPTRTGVSWLATSVTALVASTFAGARLVAVVGVRRLLVAGLTVLAAGGLWLTRLPADAGYALDLLPAFLLAGVGLGLCAPSVQIGALSGVSESEAGLASGLVETIREIGGAAGVATVTTMLVSRTGLAGFHAAFAIIGVLAIVGAVTASKGFRCSGPALDDDAQLTGAGT